MIDLIEVFDRAETGPLTSETDYYMKRYVPKLSEVIARHDGSLYHGDHPSRFMIRIPLRGAP